MVKILLLALFASFAGATAFMAAPDTCKCDMQWRLDPTEPGGLGSRCISLSCTSGCPEIPEVLEGSGTEDDPFQYFCLCNAQDDCLCNAAIYVVEVEPGVFEREFLCTEVPCNDATKTCLPSTATAFWQDVCGCI
jgi:hypothetical protein